MRDTWGPRSLEHGKIKDCIIFERQAHGWINRWTKRNQRKKRKKGRKDGGEREEKREEGIKKSCCGVEENVSFKYPVFVD